MFVCVCVFVEKNVYVASPCQICVYLHIGGEGEYTCWWVHFGVGEEVAHLETEERIKACIKFHFWIYLYTNVKPLRHWFKVHYILCTCKWLYSTKCSWQSSSLKLHQLQGTKWHQELIQTKSCVAWKTQVLPFILSWAVLSGYSGVDHGGFQKKAQTPCSIKLNQRQRNPMSCGGLSANRPIRAKQPCHEKVQRRKFGFVNGWTFVHRRADLQWSPQCLTLAETALSGSGGVTVVFTVMSIIYACVWGGLWW